MRSQVAAAVQVAIHLDRQRDGGRVLAEIGVFQRNGDEMLVFPAWRYDMGPVGGWDVLTQILGPHLVGSRQ